LYAEHTVSVVVTGGDAGEPAGGLGDVAEGQYAHSAIAADAMLRRAVAYKQPQALCARENATSAVRFSDWTMLTIGRSPT
jgi:hypothetical protein